MNTIAFEFARDVGGETGFRTAGRGQ